MKPGNDLPIAGPPMCCVCEVLCESVRESLRDCGGETLPRASETVILVHYLGGCFAVQVAKTKDAGDLRHRSVTM